MRIVGATRMLGIFLRLLLGMVLGVAVATAGTDPAAATSTTFCSALNRHPCLPHRVFCSAFRHRPCAPEIDYPYGEQLQLTINSRSDGPGSPSAPAGDASPEPALQLETIRDVFARLRACWQPPAPGASRPGMQLSVRLSFKRNGELIGPPRITYVSPDTPEQARQTYWDAVMAALHRCTPLAFSKGLGSALAGRPFAIRFVDDRQPS